MYTTGRQGGLEVEASKTGSVYTNCDLLLSADAVPDSTVSLFRSAQISSNPWKACMPPSRGSTLGVRVSYVKVHRTFGQMIQMIFSPAGWAHLCPLDTRAWCYQERRMAPRILHFGVDELHWDCMGEVRCQCGVFGPDPGRMAFKGDRIRQ
ncbi:hypothetical protein G7Y89_g12716 [Cudoniella acicularis]|uniref:Uncharacterized protein n=1 Tax=Cudoniella acicularis TaxID=354080 RepID=A0A8H4VX39_9HELO|nr:hypothetical protein G7Y89_g12716 [Cudoniella acicularis]